MKLKLRQDRYSQQELVLGFAAQMRLQKAKVAVLGLGALGSVAAELLARAGIGNLTLIDRDLVELGNLQRQLLYKEGDVGKPKAEAAFHRLKSINSDVHYNCFIADINHKNVEKILTKHDLILDCTDNLYTRFLLNDFCKRRGIPWIYAAAIKEKGCIMLITPKMPCFRCTYKEAQGLDTCDTMGVTNAITTAIASIQVNEAVHYLSIGKKQESEGNDQCLISIDFSSVSISKIKTRENPSCPVCVGKYAYLDGKMEPRQMSYQCSGTYQFFLDDLNLKTLKSRWRKIGRVREGKGYLFFGDIAAFSNGRVIIRAKSLELAKAALAKYVGV